LSGVVCSEKHMELPLNNLDYNPPHVHSLYITPQNHTTDNSF